jgi:hypothetical protein
MPGRGFFFAFTAVVSGIFSVVAKAEHDPPDFVHQPDVPKCTHVLGFSQTADWFLAPVFRRALQGAEIPPEAGAIFESIVDGDKWQLQWAGGAGVNVYANPDHPAWTSPVVSACEHKSDRPERLVYMVSGPHGLNVGAWVSDIEIVVQNIRAKFPSVRVIALQPVVGAPADEPGDACPTPTPSTGSGLVRASWQATPILEAIEIVAAAHGDVVVGATTRLRQCGHYVDSIGHIASSTLLSGAATAAVDTGLFYKDFDWR